MYFNNGTVFVGTKKDKVYAITDENHDGKADKVYVVASKNVPNGMLYLKICKLIVHISVIEIDGIESN